jgi:hypothetical protein
LRYKAAWLDGAIRRSQNAAGMHGTGWAYLKIEEAIPGLGKKKYCRKFRLTFEAWVKIGGYFGVIFI